MPRLQKKCLMVSFGMHGLLLFVLLLGSAFFRPAPQTSFDASASHGDSPVIQMVTLPPQGAPAASITSQPANANQQLSTAQLPQEKQLFSQRKAWTFPLLLREDSISARIWSRAPNNPQSHRLSSRLATSTAKELRSPSITCSRLFLRAAP